MKKTALIVLILAMVLVGAWLGYSAINPSYTLSGKFTDADSGKAVQGVTLKAGDKQVTSGRDGSYRLQGIKKNATVEVQTPKEYHPEDIHINYEQATKIGWNAREIYKDYSLAITEEEKKARLNNGITQIYDAFKFERWEDVYDLMHPDSQKEITKTKYIKTLEDNFEDYTITDYTAENLKFLDTWTLKGKEYKNAAQADISIKVQVIGITQTINQSVHFVKDNNQWKWFYSPGDN